MLSEGIWVAIILSLPGTAAVALTWWNGRKIKRMVSDVAGQVEEVHKTTNSKMDKLLIVTGDAARAEGKAEGRAEHKAEQEERRP